MILIRTDANEYIGLGHLMRCMSVATALRTRKKQVIFATSDNSGTELIRQNGFESVCLNIRWDKLEGELPLLLDIINRYSIKLVLIDSYYVTDEYFKILSSHVELAYFDDMNKSVWMVDCLINYNIFAASYDYSDYQKAGIKLFLGPRFAPLRDEFRHLCMHECKSQVTDVFISAGGSDPAGITETLIKTICKKRKEIIFHVIIGSLNSKIEMIKALPYENIVLHIDEKKISEIMTKCDIAISAAGTTLYELCSCGVPTITYSIADNQIIAAEQFDKLGIMMNAGDCRNEENFLNKLETEFDKLLCYEDLRRKYSDSMQNLVDGNGADRIAEELIRGIECQV